MSEADREQLARKPFCDFVGTTEGERLAKQLITKLLEQVVSLGSFCTSALLFCPSLSTFHHMPYHPLALEKKSLNSFHTSFKNFPAHRLARAAAMAASVMPR